MVLSRSPRPISLRCAHLRFLLVTTWKWHSSGLPRRWCLLADEANAAFLFGELTVGDVGGLRGASVIAGCETVCKRCAGLEHVKRSLIQTTSEFCRIVQYVSVVCRSPRLAQNFGSLKIA